MFKKMPLGIKLIIFYFICTVFFDFVNFGNATLPGAAFWYYFYLPIMGGRLSTLIGLIKLKKWSIPLAISILCLDIFMEANNYFKDIGSQPIIVLSIVSFLIIALCIRIIFYLKKDAVKQYFK